MYDQNAKSKDTQGTSQPTSAATPKSTAKSQLAGKSYDEQVQMLSPDSGGKSAKVDEKSLAGPGVWPVLLDSGTSTTDISVQTAKGLGFERGKKFGFEMNLQALHKGTEGGFRAPISLTELGPEAADVFEGGGANLRGAGSASFTLDATRDAKGNITQSTGFPVVAANNGLLNVLRLGSSLRAGYTASAAAQDKPTTTRTTNGNTLTTAGPKGTRNVVAAKLTTGQDAKKGDVRQENSYQQGAANLYDSWLFSEGNLGAIVGMLLKDSGAPDSALKTRTSDVMAGYNQGVAGSLQKREEVLAKDPAKYCIKPDVSLAACTGGVAPSKWPSSATQAYKDSLKAAYHVLHQNVKAAVIAQLSLPSMGSTGASGALENDKSFDAVKSALLTSLRDAIAYKQPNDAGFNKALKTVLEVELKEGKPSSAPIAPPSNKTEKVNVEGGVGGAKTH
jgi:hypothetical protein